jgi:hypothetical protein
MIKSTYKKMKEVLTSKATMLKTENANGRF